MTTNTKLYLYPVWLRIWHGANALLFICLIITGISLQYASAEYHSWLRFDRSIRIHNVCGILLTINYVFFFVTNFTARNFSHYKFSLTGLMGRLKKQFFYYVFGIFRGEHPPFPVSEKQKFNPLQQFTYAIVMYGFVPAIFLTGWLLLFPHILPDNILGIPGIFFTDIIHVIMGFLGSVFMLVHIYFCTIGATFWSNFKSIINGWHEPH